MVGAINWLGQDVRIPPAVLVGANQVLCCCCLLLMSMDTSFSSIYPTEGPSVKKSVKRAVVAFRFFR
jgi:hypothetical protein